MKFRHAPAVRWQVGSLVLAAVATVGASAHAQSASPPAGQGVRAASAGYDRATAAYLEHDYATAATWFETAHRLGPTARSLQSAIRAHRAAGTPEHFARAATLAVQLTAQYPGESAAVESARRSIEQLAPQLARLSLRCERCDIQVDGVLQGVGDVFVAPGHHRVVATWSNGRTASHDVDGSAGSTESVVLSEPLGQTGSAVASTPEVGAANAPSRSHSPGTGSRGGVSYVALGALGVGGAAAIGLGVAAVIVWFDARAVGAQLIMVAESTQRVDAGLLQRVSSGEDVTRGLAVASGITAALTFAGGLTYALTRPRSRPEIAVSPTLSGAVVHGRF